MSSGEPGVDFTMDVGRKPKKPMMIALVIVVQIDDAYGPSRPYLRLADHRELPVGCATVVEKDAQIERERQVVMQAMRKKE